MPVEERQSVPVAVKPIIQAGLDNLEIVREIRRYVRWRSKRIGKKAVIAAAVDEEIFGFRRPVARQFGFDAGAERAPGRRGRSGHRWDARTVTTECVRHMDKTDPAGEIDQRRAGDEADAAAQRCVPAIFFPGIYVVAGAVVVKIREKLTAAEIAEIAFDADQPRRRELQIVSGSDAAGPTRRVEVD